MMAMRARKMSAHDIVAAGGYLIPGKDDLQLRGEKGCMGLS